MLNAHRARIAPRGFRAFRRCRVKFRENRPGAPMKTAPSSAYTVSAGALFPLVFGLFETLRNTTERPMPALHYTRGVSNPLSA